MEKIKKVTESSTGGLAGSDRSKNSRKMRVPSNVRTIEGKDAFMDSRSQSRPASNSTPARTNYVKKEEEVVSEPRYTAQKVDGTKSAFFIEPKLRILALGGLEETGGKNCIIFEYKDDIIVIDLGFMFPDSDMPGVDYVIPDVSYLEKNKHKIRGLLVSHAHLDHIGAIPYVYQKIGSPPIYSAPLSIGIIKSKLEEFGLDRGAKLNPIEIGVDKLKLGVFEIETFKLTHSIPQTMGFAIHTPEGIIVHAIDWKFDHTPADRKPTDFAALAALGGKKPLALMIDSTNVDRPGVSVSEKEIEDAIFKIVDKARGRLIIATFSTLISRIQQIINTAHHFQRKVAFVGRSMQQTAEIAISLNALTIPPDTLIDSRKIGDYPDDKICIICTGSQGEDNAALSRIATGEHRQVRIKRGDLVVLSSSPIPGNERSVSDLMDNLYRAGARVIYQKIMGVHTSGHANQEDLKLMMALIRPQYLIPIHGERHRLMLQSQMAQDMGIVDEAHCLVADDGQIMEFSKGKGEVTNKRVPASYVMVDGLGVGDVGNIVLRDRRAMAQDGIFVIILTVDHKTGEIATSPDIISRGFIYMRENEQLVHKSRAEIKNLFKKHVGDNGAHADWGLIKQKLRDDIGEFLFRETERRPMVIPVVIEV